jgi:hypothetical protein
MLGAAAKMPLEVAALVGGTLKTSAFSFYLVI